MVVTGSTRWTRAQIGDRGKVSGKKMVYARTVLGSSINGNTGCDGGIHTRCSWIVPPINIQLLEQRGAIRAPVTTKQATKKKMNKAIGLRTPLTQDERCTKNKVRRQDVVSDDCQEHTHTHTPSTVSSMLSSTRNKNKDAIESYKASSDDGW